MGVEGLTKEEAQLLLTGKLSVTRDAESGKWAESNPVVPKRQRQQRSNFTIGRRQLSETEEKKVTEQPEQPKTNSDNNLNNLNNLKQEKLKFMGRSCSVVTRGIR